MRVLLVSPSIPPEATGNAATAGRLRTSLGALGTVVTLARAAELADAPGLSRHLQGQDLLHVHHLVKSGRLLLPVPAGGWPPVVASAGGTDLVPLPPGDADILRRVMDLAVRVLVPTDEACRRLTRAHDGWKAKCRLVPRGVTLRAPGEPLAGMFDLRAASGAAPGEILFFLPAGFRPVKRNAFAVGPLALLRARGVPLRFVAAGPVLSTAAAEAFDRSVSSDPWARRFPAFPPEARATVLGGADVVLNTSAHEGMSNAVLEAMLAGRAVLASGIPGNRAVIRDAETGLLFSGAEDFAARAERLARDAGLRARLGGAARAAALSRFTPEREAQAVHAAYRDALAGTDRGGPA